MFYNCNDVDDHDAGAGVHDLRAGEKSGGEPGLKYSGDAKRAILDNVLTDRDSFHPILYTLHRDPLCWAPRSKKGPDQKVLKVSFME